MDLLLLLLRLLMAAALYLFLGTILLLLWRDLRRPTESATVVPRHYGRLVVVVVESEDEDAEETLKVGTTFPLQAVTSLGRSAINTVIIPDAYASSEHALLLYRGGQWWLEDRGSRNGTTINTVAINSPTVVSAGDVIGIGQVQLKLELGEAEIRKFGDS
jgi:pSer/pThr/pTyr-binding forkhead associated (FHA) protein